VIVAPASPPPPPTATAEIEPWLPKAVDVSVRSSRVKWRINGTVSSIATANERKQKKKQSEKRRVLIAPDYQEQQAEAKRGRGL
jgi:hypothetical protein